MAKRAEMPLYDKLGDLHVLIADICSSVPSVLVHSAMIFRSIRCSVVLYATTRMRDGQNLT